MSIAANEIIEERDARTPSHSKQSLRLWLRLFRCTTIVEKTVRNRLAREFGATLPRFDLLSVLHRRPAGMTMSELSGHLLVSNGNVTGLVNRLEADGLVKRQALVTDRRAFHVKLTAKGRRTFASMTAVHEQWIDGLFHGLSDADIQQLLDLLERTDRSVQEAVSRESEHDR